MYAIEIVIVAYVIRNDFIGPKVGIKPPTSSRANSLC